MKRIGWAGAVGLVLVGCINGGKDSAFPLYEGKPLPPEEVATLTGDVDRVDNQSVSEHGRHFDLEPGCHTVTNVTTWGGYDPSAAIMAHLPPLTFALEMKAGLSYVLRIALVGSPGEGGHIEITAVEQDSSGKVLRRFEPGGHC